MITGLATDSFMIRLARWRYILIRIAYRAVYGKKKRNEIFTRKNIVFYNYIPHDRVYSREGFNAYIRSKTDDFVQLFTVREEPIRKYIDLKNTPGELYVDVGANVGYYVLSLGTKYPGCEILAIEANPTTFEALKNNVALNGHLNRRVECVNAAVMDYKGKITMYERVVGDGSTITSHSSIYQDVDRKKEVVVDCTTLDALTAEKPIVHLLKIDVEGAEIAVLAGAAGTLKKTKRIVVEIHGDNLNKVVEMVKPFFADVELAPFGPQYYVIGENP
jgi:FkbM family methyltransferase